MQIIVRLSLELIFFEWGLLNHREREQYNLGKGRGFFYLAGELCNLGEEVVEIGIESVHLFDFV